MAERWRAMTAVIHLERSDSHTSRVLDPLRGSSWSSAATVAGFAQSSPNPVLMRFAEAELPRTARAHVMDIGCGAARDSVPLARAGHMVLGTAMFERMNQQLWQGA
jgi:2-polyprenyl-3-methyl-5-hydroxy-6-metoxy-1,4-benzoquinol methylase